MTKNKPFKLSLFVMMLFAVGISMSAASSDEDDSALVFVKDVEGENIRIFKLINEHVKSY